jgi:hypothetical protein
MFKVRRWTSSETRYGDAHFYLPSERADMYMYFQFRQPQYPYISKEAGRSDITYKSGKYLFRRR